MTSVAQNKKLLKITELKIWYAHHTLNIEWDRKPTNQNIRAYI